MRYTTRRNTNLPPTVVDVMNDSDKIAQPAADQILTVVEMIAGNNYPYQWQLIRQIQDLFEDYLIWEDVRFMFLMGMVCEMQDTIKAINSSPQP